MKQPERVAVFGAGGPVGRAILEGLLDHPGLTPIAVLRRPGAAVPGVETRAADIADETAVSAALAGCSLAVNAVGGGMATLVASTRSLCRQAARVGLRRLVHVSSLAVYGGAEGMLDETAAFARYPRAYEAAKIASEGLVTAHAEAGHRAVILRPGIVFGPGSVQWAHRIARLLRARRLGDLGAAGDGFCNLTHEADLGRAAVAALLALQAENLSFNVATAAPLSWNRVFEVFARALGAVPVCRVGSRRLRLETRLFAPPLRLARLAGARIGVPAGTLPEPIPASLLGLFGQRMRVDPSLTDRILAINRTPDEDGIVATAARLPRG